MDCSWKEEQAYRFADGSMEPEAARAFVEHVDACDSCQEWVEEAKGLEQLLSGGIVAVAPPATLASRVALAAEAERGRRRFPWSWLPGMRRVSAAGGRGTLAPHSVNLSPALAIMLAVLAFSVITVVAAPGAVMAVVQRALLFVPGLGISAVDEGYLVATGPVSDEKSGVRFTLEALLSDGEWTTVKFNVTGLPGGKEGWERERPVRVGEGEPPAMPERRPGRPPYLQDETGHRYEVRWSTYGIGGSPQENRMEGQMSFAPLPADLVSVDIVVPMDNLIPPSVIPDSDKQEWVLRIALAPAAESDLPQATPQGASATDKGVTLRVAASTVERDRTVVLLEGDGTGSERMMWVGSNGGNLAEEVTLTDNWGRTYELKMDGSRGRVGEAQYSEDLYFAPLAPGAQQLTLTVNAVRVGGEGTARVTIDLSGRPRGESFDLNREVRLGEHTVLLKSARVEGNWLYLDVDLGPEVGGRALSTFSLDGSRSWSSSMGAMDGAQVDHFGVGLEPGEERVELELARPMLNVKGEWKMTFPVGAR